MSNILIQNAHHYYPFSEGKLNTALVERMSEHLQAKGHEIKTTTMGKDYDVQQEVEKHLWADVVILQTPVNWMGVPWSFKKYMDEVYSAGMMGDLCEGDGRTSADPKKGYGTGGSLRDTKYMLSLTFNAPVESFNDESEWFFAGKSIDDLFLPMHLNFKFFGMEPLPTVSCHDVMKNPEVEKDFERLEAHLNAVF